jgi:hypothetical protein
MNTDEACQTNTFIYICDCCCLLGALGAVSKVTKRLEIVRLLRLTACAQPLGYTFGITGFVKVIHRLCRFLHTPNNGQAAKLLVKMRS